MVRLRFPCRSQRQGETCIATAASLPDQIADIAYQNKAVIYDLLSKAPSETMRVMASKPGALLRCGI